MKWELLGSNILMVLYGIVWFYLFWKYRGKDSYITPVSLIMLSYAIYVVFSIFVYNQGISIAGDIDYKGLTLFPFVYLFLMLYIYLLPACVYEKKNVSRIQRPTTSIITIVLLIYVVFRLYLIPSEVQMLRDGMNLLFTSDDGGAYLYEYREEFMDQYKRQGGLLTSIAGIYTSFLSDIYYFFFFYYLTIRKPQKWLAFPVVVLIAIDILLPFGYGNRTDPVLTIYGLVMAALIFYKYYEPKLRKLINRVSIISIVIVSVPLALISISRFEASDYIEGGTVGYIGQANLNFNQYVFDAGGNRHGDRIFNFFKKSIGLETTKGVLDTRDKYKLKIDDAHFTTFVGDYVLDIGAFGAVVFIVISTLLFIQLTKPRSHTILFHQLLLLYYLLCVSMKGGFYLYPYAFNRAGILISYLFFYIVFLLDYNSNQRATEYLQKNVSE